MPIKEDEIPPYVDRVASKYQAQFVARNYRLVSCSKECNIINWSVEKLQQRYALNYQLVVSLRSAGSESLRRGEWDLPPILLDYVAYDVTQVFTLVRASSVNQLVSSLSPRRGGGEGDFREKVFVAMAELNRHFFQMNMEAGLGYRTVAAIIEDEEPGVSNAFDVCVTPRHGYPQIVSVCLAEKPQALLSPMCSVEDARAREDVRAPSIKFLHLSHFEPMWSEILCW